MWNPDMFDTGSSSIDNIPASLNAWIPKEPEYIGSAEVSEMLDVAISTVNRWAKAGYLPSVRQSSGSGNPGWLFNRKRIEAVVEDRKEGFMLMAMAEKKLGITDIYQHRLAGRKSRRKGQK